MGRHSFILTCCSEGLRLGQLTQLLGSGTVLSAWGCQLSCVHRPGPHCTVTAAPTGQLNGRDGDGGRLASAHFPLYQRALKGEAAWLPTPQTLADVVISKVCFSPRSKVKRNWIGQQQTLTVLYSLQSFSFSDSSKPPREALLL